MTARLQPICGDERVHSSVTNRSVTFVHKMLFSEMVLLSIAIAVALGSTPGILKFGDVSLYGVITLTWTSASVLAVLGGGTLSKSAMYAFVPMFLFAAWASVSLAMNRIENLQQLAALAAFISIAVLACQSAEKRPQSSFVLLRIIEYATLGPVAMFVIAYFGLHNPAAFFNLRGFSILLLVGLAAACGRWRYGSRFSLLLMTLYGSCIVLSLSRTASVVAVLLVPASNLGRRQSKRALLKVILGLAVGFLTFVVLVTQVDSIRDRFFFGKDLGDYMEGTATLNTAGRAEMWAMVYSSWNQNLQTRLLGQGPGTASEMADLVIPGIGHPHNDYLRVLHDFGAIGLMLFVIGLTSITWRVFLRWRSSDRNYENAAVHCSAFLALLSLWVLMITDNPITYVFSLAPTAVLVGNSIGMSKNTRLMQRLPPGVEDRRFSFVAPPTSPIQTS